MKRLIVVLVLLAFVAAVAYASLRTTKQKAAIKTEKKEMKKQHHCNHTCMFS
jgi:type II secretory pathway pseudopilin PulG